MFIANSCVSEAYPLIDRNTLVTVGVRKYRVLQKIATGSYGIVYSGHDEASSCVKVAIKVSRLFLNGEDVSEQYAKDIACEAKMLAALSAGRMCHLIELKAHGPVDCTSAFYQPKVFRVYVMVTQLLQTTLEKRMLVRCDLLQVQKIARQALEALAFLHTLHVTHADIKPDNVGIDEKGNVCLFDFGISCRQIEKYDYRFLAENENCYRPPEVYSKVPLSEKVDIFGLGMILLRLYSGRQLPNRAVDLYTWLCEGDPDDHYHLERKQFAELLWHMLETNPVKRIAAIDALKQSLFQPPEKNTLHSKSLVYRLVQTIEEDSKQILCSSGHASTSVRIRMSKEGAFHELEAEYEKIQRARSCMTEPIEGFASYFANRHVFCISLPNDLTLQNLIQQKALPLGQIQTMIAKLLSALCTPSLENALNALYPKMIDASGKLNALRKGTEAELPYRAPEVDLCGQATTASLMWSLGCLIYEMYTQKTLFASDTATRLAEIHALVGPIPFHILHNGRHTVDYFTKQIKTFVCFKYETNYFPQKEVTVEPLRLDNYLFEDLIKELLSVDPTLRPTPEQALQNPFMHFQFS